ncbi:glycogen debranching protein GlgX [Streptomyces sp. H27-D2]|uniref:glycogen debranching protein GlgX n=1 Tax=Streptomyces sp. H27-D2 TaxID=3046304 RepID=UPI002DBB8509|nr:glycogen debranching protein GlgX [Streptomyces sp. H27-D2]MEC4017871.1 glycogen debranching protein GlgX [Streptomyces sp. H27-D2]
MTETRPGDPYRLGADWDGQGVNFAVHSSAGAYGGDVVLCLLGEDGRENRVPLSVDCDIWHAYLPEVRPGQRYGFRARGPYDPARGLFFDPGTLLLDPYAKAMSPGGPGAPRKPVCRVADTAFDWGADSPPNRPWSRTVLYETHVKGISATHPEVPEHARGSYAGLAHPAVIGHLIDLGVTAVELLPVHQHLPEQFLLDRGLTNYWGYSTIGFFAPHAGYSSAGGAGEQITEFKRMVAALHAAGLEVILDVVYNHTAEGPPFDPALSFRGLANEVYYRLDPTDPSRYIDTTGTRNTLDTGRPEVLRLIMDSLRYWVRDMHVDGFRFDLAATLARQHGYVDRLSAFFDLLYQDPVLNRTKLIAEPWDVGAPDSYQVGRFPAGWAEWNDRYRDTVRDFWRGRSAVADLGARLTGSADLYAADRRGPDASVNFAACHDGKTLTDLVSYERKHNEANGEDNRDGGNDDRAANYGVEGPTPDPEITAVRQRQQRNILTTLLVSQGATMLYGGDEIGRTQGGNNNAYCQDNRTSWYDWAAQDTSLSSFVRRVVALQRDHPALQRRSFLRGESAPPGSPGGPALPDIGWYDRTGQPMTTQRWQDPATRFLGLLLAGDRVDPLTPEGRPQRDDDLLVLFNADTTAADFTVPGRPGSVYRIVLDTTAPDGAPAPADALKSGDLCAVPPRTTIVAVSPLPAPGP